MSRAVIAMISLALVLPVAAGSAQAPAPSVAPFVGDWVGTGWGTEVRFRQSRGEFVQQLAGGRLPPGAGGNETIMSLTVKHQTAFVVTVAADGQITGQGEITYDLFPNLCGVAALTKQVNEAVDRMDLMPKIFKLATEVGSRSVERFHAQWFEEEAKLAQQIDIIESSAREFETLGPAAREGALGRVASSLALRQGQPASVQDLVKAVVFNRCSRPGYRFPGSSNPCLDLLARPMAKEIDGAAKIAFDAALGQTLDRLLDEAKGKMQSLGVRDVTESSACAAAPNALRAGTAVGPETLAELAVQMGGAGAAALGEMATGGVPSGLLLSIPGVTQVQYSYKGLSKGPEGRRLRIKGRLEPTADGSARMHLEMDGDVLGDKNLYVEYSVNYRGERRPFPTWSPFLSAPAEAKTSGVERVLERRAVKGGKEATVARDIVRRSPFAVFHERGQQRNGVRVWHEYDYYWNAHKIVEPVAGKQ
jgi:hypothetical protein